MLEPEHRDRTFVILATSHYGEPEQFGLTRKNYRTPMGEAQTDQRLVDWLAERGGAGVQMEDYCHSFEHTVELQVIFLQHMLGAGVKVLPVLCGSFARSLYQGGEPEDDDEVKAFLEALGELRDREGDSLFWVLGVDMAHMGARYQDQFSAVAGEGVMSEVGVARRGAHRPHQPLRRGGLLGPAARESRRPEVVRLLALLHLSEDRTQIARRTASLRAVEHRRAERGEFRGNGFFETGVMA